MTSKAKSNNLPIDTIIHLYTIERKTSTQIAETYSTTSSTILILLRKNNITIKDSSHRIDINIDELNRLYSVEHLSAVDVGKYFGVTRTVIFRNLRENNIPTRPNRGSNQYKKSLIQPSELPPFFKEPKLINHNLTAKITCPDCDETRRTRPLHKKLISNIVNNNGRCKSCTLKARAIPLDIETVKHLYNQGTLTTRQIANRLNASADTIYRCMRQNSIHIRTKGETEALLYKNKVKVNNKGTLELPVIGDICLGYDIGQNDNYRYTKVVCPQCKQDRWQQTRHIKRSPLCKVCSTKRRGLKHRGENAPNWHGGKSFEPYTTEFNEDLKEQIRERDNYTCQLCGTPQNGTALAVHHIDYMKQNCHPNNLISLCPSPSNSHCHIKTNRNREYWTEHFNNLLKQRGVLVLTS